MSDLTRSRGERGAAGADSPSTKLNLGGSHEPAPPAALRRTHRQSGQILVLLALVLVVLLGISALVIDLGYAYYTQRSLQASADAAALAGASGLPDSSTAVDRAREYAGSPGGKNRRGNIPPVQTEVTMRCISVAPCNPVNAIVVVERTVVPTKFARVLGFDEIEVSARATAGHARVRELHGPHHRQDRPGGAAAALGSRCSTPSGLAHANYNSTSSSYVLVPLSDDFKTNGELNRSSQLVSTIECVRAGGVTSYATALEKAQGELAAHGRPEAPDVIVFLSDGAANYGPSYYGNSSNYRRRPCRQGVTSAGAIKSAGRRSTASATTSTPRTAAPTSASRLPAPTNRPRSRRTRRCARSPATRARSSTSPLPAT